MSEEFECRRVSVKSHRFAYDINVSIRGKVDLYG